VPDETPAPRSDARNREDRDASERRFRAFAYALGLSALAITAWHAFLTPQIIAAHLVPAAFFSLFIGFAWYFSFSIFPKARLSISLDMAYLMTAICVLPEPVPIMVAFCGAVVGSLLRFRETRSAGKPFLQALSLNTGGLVLAAVVGRWVAWAMAEHWQFRTMGWWTVLCVAALFVTYNVTNVLTMVVAMLLKRDPVVPHLASYARVLSSIEVFTLPLCLGLALLYAGSGIWGFVPLAVTILLASGLLKKLNQTRTDLGEVNTQLQDRWRELRILNTIGKDINSSLDPEVVFQQISRHVQRILDAPHLFLSLYHRLPSEEYIEFVARDGQVQPRPERALGQGFTAWLLESRRHVLIMDLSVDRESIQCAPVVLDPAVRSIMATPLIFNNEVFGLLCVQSPRPQAYTVDHLNLLSTVGQQAAIALENARNFQMATVDQLTGLFLRDYFYRKVSDEQVRSRRYGSTFTLLMLDLDSFKAINDRLGHLSGDRYLQRVGEAIRETMRAADVPCRYGGEEFCILLPETDVAGALKIADRIRRRIANLEVRVGRGSIRTTISVGVAAYPADYPGSIQGLIEKADQALYVAKQGGRDRVVAANTVGAEPARRAR
jgi:diguanylate cyclase (GGDEF)-like protein